MEELVRQQRQDEVAELARRVRERRRRHDVVLAGAVLQAAAEIDGRVHHVEEDRVGLVRWRAAHKQVLHLRHLLDGAAEGALHGEGVVGGRPQRDADPAPVHLHRVERILADERHRVRELVIIGGAVHAASRPLQRRGHLPPRRQREAHFGGSVQLSFLVQEQIGAERFAEIVGELREREVDGVGEVIELHRDAVAASRRHPPRILVGPIPEQWLPGHAPGAEMAHVARVVLDLVSARAPRGQREVERVLAARGELGLHVEESLGRRGDRHLVANGLSRGERGNREQQGAKLSHGGAPWNGTKRRGG